MKKFIYAFALVGLFTFAVPKTANTQPELTFPGTFHICGHTCLCDDQQDYDFYVSQFCGAEGMDS